MAARLPEELVVTELTKAEERRFRAVVWHEALHTWPNNSESSMPNKIVSSNSSVLSRDSLNSSVSSSLDLSSKLPKCSLPPCR